MGGGKRLSAMSGWCSVCVLRSETGEPQKRENLRVPARLRQPGDLLSVFSCRLPPSLPSPLAMLVPRRDIYASSPCSPDIGM